MLYTGVELAPRSCSFFDWGQYVLFCHWKDLMVFKIQPDILIFVDDNYFYITEWYVLKNQCEEQLSQSGCSLTVYMYVMWMIYICTCTYTGIYIDNCIQTPAMMRLMLHMGVSSVWSMAWVDLQSLFVFSEMYIYQHLGIVGLCITERWIRFCELLINYSTSCCLTL